MVTAFMLGTLAAPAPARANGDGDGPRDRDRDHYASYTARDTERIQRSLAFSGTGARRLEVDNVWGSIQVAAYDGQTVEISITRTLRARTPELLETARKEVTLDVTEEPSLISLYVDGPFRDCDCDNWRSRSRFRSRSQTQTSAQAQTATPAPTPAQAQTQSQASTAPPPWRRRNRGDLGYVVEYDFVIKTPRAVSIGLSTVNDGDIRVEGTAGDFDVDNVNGGIDMVNVAGSGDAHTVNGPVTVLFQRNPASASSFKSVNGELIVYFDPSLQADLSLKTMNGKFYSDFDSTMLTATKPVAQRVDGQKFVYRFDRGTGLRVGRGGPEIRFETLNGDIRILHRGR
jgi:hypothetical protein